MASLLFSLLVAIGLCGVKSATVIVGDPFVFPFTCDGESGKLVRNSVEKRQQVAVYEHGEWKPIEQYRDWIRGNSSVIVFTRTFYPDSKVIYEVSCGNNPEQVIQLDVVVAQHVSVRAGEAALLPCFSDPKDNPGSSVVWEKNGTVVCELKHNSTSGGCSRSADKRLSLSQNWSSSGDMSLTLEQVQPEDQGDYFCSGSKTPVRLKVTETHNRTCPNPDPDPKPMETWIIIIITASVTLLVSACPFLIYWFLHSHRTKFPITNAGEPSSHEMDIFLSNHSDSQANGGQSRM